MVNKDYKYLKAPIDFPGSIYKGFCYEHHLVLWHEFGIILGKGQCVHHKNKNKQDNRPENLEIREMRKHSKEHNEGRIFHSAWLKLQCPECKRIFSRERRQTHLKKGTGATFCSRQCSGKFYQRPIEERERFVMSNVKEEFEVRKFSCRYTLI